MVHLNKAQDSKGPRPDQPGHTGQGPNTHKGLFGFKRLKFNSRHINVPSNAWSTKCRLIACMSAQIRSNLRDESTKPNNLSITNRTIGVQLTQNSHAASVAMLVNNWVAMQSS
jgi:hypothetical protein